MERRQHNTPFTTEGPSIKDADGKVVALCDTPAFAHFVCTVCNFWDRLVGAFDLCRGHFENMTNPDRNPAYRQFIKLWDELHEALRGNHN